MSAKFIRAGGLIAAALFAVTAIDGVRDHVLPGVWAEEYQQAKQKPRRRAARRETVESGSNPADIARYFQLYGGYIDPSINRQTPGGPFDSGFFFDSGIGRNGGQSPYMN